MASNNGAQVASAVAALDAFAELDITTPGAYDPESLPTVAFDRLSVERRVLGHITDEVDKSDLGPRNTLAALTYALMNDRNTTHPPETHARLETAGKTTAEIAQSVLDYLTFLVEAGLVAQREDGSYKVTKAGHAELAR